MAATTTLDHSKLAPRPQWVGRRQQCAQPIMRGSLLSIHSSALMDRIATCREGEKDHKGAFSLNSSHLIWPHLTSELSALWLVKITANWVGSKFTTQFAVAVRVHSNRVVMYVQTENKMLKCARFSSKIKYVSNVRKKTMEHSFQMRWGQMKWDEMNDMNRGMGYSTSTVRCQRGQGYPNGSQSSEKNVVFMFKYAVFDIKTTHNQICINL